MPHPIKHHYKDDSPGGRRKAAGLTLQQIRRERKAFATSAERTAVRRKLQGDGLLG